MKRKKRKNEKGFFGWGVRGIGEVVDGLHHVMLQKQPKRTDRRLMGPSDTRTQRVLNLFVVSCMGVSHFFFLFFFI